MILLLLVNNKKTAGKQADLKNAILTSVKIILLGIGLDQFRQSGYTVAAQRRNFPLCKKHIYVGITSLPLNWYWIFNV